MKIVVDTNVIVSAFISPNGSPAKVLALILNEKIKILYDNRIILPKNFLEVYECD